MPRLTKRGLTMVVAGFSALAVAGTPLSALANPSQQEHQATSMYTAQLHQLNDTGVHGQAHLKYHAGSGNQADALRVNLSAHGTTPDQIHPVHIHGNTHPEVAFCPTDAQDVDNDGFVSVIEGAATYGPIKLNLTSPQTPFGTPPTPALFTPFAGTPVMSTFPMANAGGSVHQDQTYYFDGSADARAALASLMPLENQHIVIHGAMAPASVDAPAFAALGAPVTGPLDAIVYDPLLPIACGEIKMTSNVHQNARQQEQNNVNVHENENNNQNNNANNQQNDHRNANVEHENAQQQVQDDQANAMALASNEAVAAFHARTESLMHEYKAQHQAALVMFQAANEQHRAEARDHLVASHQAAHDRYVNLFYEARNHLVDQLNQHGAIQLRDEVMAHAAMKVQAFSHEFEAAKAEFLHSSSN